MRLRIHRSDGKIGTYSQKDRTRAELLLKRLDPSKIFVSGPIVVGVLNPFSVIHPDEVCWVEIESDLDTIKTFPPEVDNVRKMAGCSFHSSPVRVRASFHNSH